MQHRVFALPQRHLTRMTRECCCHVLSQQQLCSKLLHKVKAECPPENGSSVLQYGGYREGHKMWPLAFTVITDVQTNDAIFPKQCRGFTIKSSNTLSTCTNSCRNMYSKQKALMLRPRTNKTVCVIWDKDMQF